MSRTEYKIGHFVTLRNTGNANIEGQRCEILTSLSPQILTDATGRERMVMGYEVLFSDGSTAVIEPNSMAKLTREMDRIVRWSDCAWQPKPVLVEMAAVMRSLS